MTTASLIVSLSWEGSTERLLPLPATAHLPSHPYTPVPVIWSLLLSTEGVISFKSSQHGGEGRGWGWGTAMSDHPPSPWECQGTAGSPGLQGQRQRKLPSGASGRSSLSSISRRHFKRRKALAFWRLTVGTGAPPGNSVTALRGLLFITPEMIVKHGVPSHLIYAQEKPSPLVLLTPFFQKRKPESAWLCRQLSPLASQCRAEMTRGLGRPQSQQVSTLHAFLWQTDVFSHIYLKWVLIL